MAVGTGKGGGEREKETERGDTETDYQLTFHRHPGRQNRQWWATASAVLPAAGLYLRKVPSPTRRLRQLESLPSSGAPPKGSGSFQIIHQLCSKCLNKWCSGGVLIHSTRSLRALWVSHLTWLFCGDRAQGSHLCCDGACRTQTILPFTHIFTYHSLL